VTGNNRITWAPDAGDWYETVKLNYGHDFTAGRATGHLPGKDAPVSEVPSTWRIMDEILAYWQGVGVDGFRADMAHMVPVEFWRWAVARAKARDPGACFVAEAYDDDPAKLTSGHVLDALLEAGFDAVYDDPGYDVLEGLYSAGKWCNDLDGVAAGSAARFHRSLRYAENHDEVRLASPRHWGGLGMLVGRPASAVLLGLGRGPVMMFNGQEVGEPATGREGFGGDDGRTSIFDYWSMPELAKWFNGGACDGGRLAAEQRDLRLWYRDLLAVLRLPAFRSGEFRPLNRENIENPRFGRLPGETASGHWLYAYLRRDPASGQACLVAANFHGQTTLRELRVRVSPETRDWLGIRPGAGVRLKSLLGPEWDAGVSAEDLAGAGLALPDLPPCSAAILSVE
jgi:hypothetical protein